MTKEDNLFLEKVTQLIYEQRATPLEYEELVSFLYKNEVLSRRLYVNYMRGKMEPPILRAATIAAGKLLSGEQCYVGIKNLFIFNKNNNMKDLDEVTLQGSALDSTRTTAITGSFDAITTNTVVSSRNDDMWWSFPELVDTIELPESIEFVYKQCSTISMDSHGSQYRAFKIVFSCIDGKWNKSERIYGTVERAQPETYVFD